VKVCPTLAAAALLAAACSSSRESKGARDDAPIEPTAVAADWAESARERMVTEQIEARDVRDARVLRAMGTVPRHEFIPGDARDHAYEDHPVPIGYDQTISQPYIVAKLVELAAVDEHSKVLEIGTGSGYTAAVLSRVAGDVYTIEIVEELANRARQTLAELGYSNVRVITGDGYAGWPEAAPYDAVIVTAAPAKIPEPLKQQLAIGGRLVIPVGDRYQELRVLTRTETGFDERTEFPVRFVPMTGKAQDD
jgi:protein-L-isoaspartate(D-aspartate) O-methyltransferase